MDQETFIQERVIKQQKWYSKESANNKKWFTRFKVAIIIVAAMIPFATGFIDTYPELQYPIGAMAVIVVILEGLVSFFKYQEKWIDFRSTSEALKKELSFFQYKVGPYEDQEIAFPLGFIITFFNQLSVSMHVHMEVFIQLQHTAQKLLRLLHRI